MGGISFEEGQFPSAVMPHGVDWRVPWGRFGEAKGTPHEATRIQLLFQPCPAFAAVTNKQLGGAIGKAAPLF